MRRFAAIGIALLVSGGMIVACSDDDAPGGDDAGGPLSASGGSVSASSGGATTGSGGSIGSGGSGAGGGPSSGGAPASDGGSSSGGTTSGDGGPSSGGASDAGPSSTAAKLGAYCGNSVADVEQFESWLGRHVDGILGYTGAASWADYDGSVGWATGTLWAPIDRPVYWSVPLIPEGASLEEAASGAYDEHYRKAAQVLVGFRPDDGTLHVRTGWELNGDWFPWAAAGKEAAFVGAFQHFVTAFRSVSTTRFDFEWNVNLADGGMNPEAAYPGDAYVDIIGMDFYWNLTWDSADPVIAWNEKVSSKYGLEWHQNFAQAHGKLTSYSEWGVQSNAAEPYIQRAHTWFERYHVVFHTYWNSNVAFTGKLSSGQFPGAGTAYRSEFGL